MEMFDSGPGARRTPRHTHTRSRGTGLAAVAHAAAGFSRHSHARHATPGGATPSGSGSRSATRDREGGSTRRGHASSGHTRSAGRSHRSSRAAAQLASLDQPSESVGGAPSARRRLDRGYADDRRDDREIPGDSDRDRDRNRDRDREWDSGRESYERGRRDHDRGRGEPARHHDDGSDFGGDALDPAFRDMVRAADFRDDRNAGAGGGGWQSHRGRTDTMDEAGMDDAGGYGGARSHRQGHHRSGPRSSTRSRGTSGSSKRRSTQYSDIGDGDESFFFDTDVMSSTRGRSGATVAHMAEKERGQGGHEEPLAAVPEIEDKLDVPRGAADDGRLAVAGDMVGEDGIPARMWSHSGSIGDSSTLRQSISEPGPRGQDALDDDKRGNIAKRGITKLRDLGQRAGKHIHQNVVQKPEQFLKGGWKGVHDNLQKLVHMGKEKDGMHGEGGGVRGVPGRDGFDEATTLEVTLDPAFESYARRHSSLRATSEAAGHDTDRRGDDHDRRVADSNDGRGLPTAFDESDVGSYSADRGRSGELARGAFVSPHGGGSARDTPPRPGSQAPGAYSSGGSGFARDASGTDSPRRQRSHGAASYGTGGPGGDSRGRSRDAGGGSDVRVDSVGPDAAGNSAAPLSTPPQASAGANGSPDAAPEMSAKPSLTRTSSGRRRTVLAAAAGSAGSSGSGGGGIGDAQFAGLQRQMQDQDRAIEQMSERVSKVSSELDVLMNNIEAQVQEATKRCEQWEENATSLLNAQARHAEEEFLAWKDRAWDTEMRRREKEVTREVESIVKEHKGKLDKMHRAIEDMRTVPTGITHYVGSKLFDFTLSGLTTVVSAVLVVVTYVLLPIDWMRSCCRSKHGSAGEDDDAAGGDATDGGDGGGVKNTHSHRRGGHRSSSKQLPQGGLVRQRTADDGFSLDSRSRRSSHVGLGDVVHTAMSAATASPHDGEFRDAGFRDRDWGRDRGERDRYGDRDRHYGESGGGGGGGGGGGYGSDRNGGGDRERDDSPVRADTQRHRMSAQASRRGGILRTSTPSLSVGAR